MSSQGRNFFHVGRKLLLSTPLGGQSVSPNDSVLGPYANSTAAGLQNGLKISYAKMIENAFVDKWWNSGSQIAAFGTTWTQMEANFSMIWGISIMMYERTLVSDQTRFDRFMDGDNTALTADERTGLGLFLNEGSCAACHHGAEFTGAATSQLRQIANPGRFQLLERMFVGDAKPAVYDNGFYNINVRPVTEDAGVGGLDPFKNPLSFSVQAVTGKVVDNLDANGGTFADPNEFPAQNGTPPNAKDRVEVLGAFKTPSLRNVDLTGPYFHTGSYLTLEQVVQFYARGTDFLLLNRQNGIMFDAEVAGIPTVNGNRIKIRAIAAFLRTLTDQRVAFEAAPFDRPSLHLPNGQVGDTTKVKPDPNLPGAALTGFIELPPVGAGGSATPIAPFLGGSKLSKSGVPTEDGLRLP
jgi:cytochrome c peroxidase